MNCCFGIPVEQGCKAIKSPWREFMKSRNLGLGLGLAILCCSMFLLAGTAAAAEPQGEACKIESLPGFTAQGEFTTTATVADVIQVECNPEIYGTKAKLTIEAF